MGKYPAVFLDKDGVLVELIVRPDGAVTQPYSVDEMRFTPHAKSAVDILRGLNYLVFVVSNQGKVGDGLIASADHLEMHAVLMTSLDIDDAVYAVDRCSEYFKPGTMMIDELCGKYDVDRARSWMVGDSWRDVKVGTNAGLKTIYLSPKHAPTIAPFKANFQAHDVLDAALIIENYGRY